MHNTTQVSYTDRWYFTQVNYTGTCYEFTQLQRQMALCVSLLHRHWPFPAFGRKKKCSWSHSNPILTRWVCRGSINSENDSAVFIRVLVCCKQLHNLVTYVCRLYDNTAVKAGLAEFGAVVVDVPKDDVNLQEEEKKRKKDSQLEPKHLLNDDVDVSVALMHCVCVLCVCVHSHVCVHVYMHVCMCTCMYFWITGHWQQSVCQKHSL